MANYSPEQVQSALQAGLVSEEDANYLMEALGNQGSGLGGALGAAGVGTAAGLLGGKGAGMLARKLAEGNPAGMAARAATSKPIPEELMGMQMPGMAANRSAASLGGGAAAGILGAGAGAYGGSQLMGQPGEGVGTEDPRDMAMRILIDPQTSKQQKQQAAMFLEQMQQQEGQEGQGMSGTEMGGMGLGAALGLGAGALAGNAGGKFLSRMAGPTAGGMQDAGRFMGNQLGGGMNVGGAGMATMGAGLGGWGGGEAGEMMTSRPYEDPLAAGM